MDWTIARWGLYLLIFLYLVTAFTLLFLHFFDLACAYFLVKKARNVMPVVSDTFLLDQCKDTRFVMSDAVASPAVWGCFHAKILLPVDWEAWSKSKLERVLVHEFAHIERCDWLINNCLKLMCSIFWFLPPVWKIAQRACRYAEYACDDVVVERLNCRAEYAEDLLEFSTLAKLNPSLVGIASSELLNRVTLILDGGRDRSLLSSPKKCGLLITAFTCLIPVYAMNINVGLPKLNANSDLYSVVDLAFLESRSSKISEPINTISRLLNTHLEEQVYLREYRPQRAVPVSFSKEIEALPLDMIEPKAFITMQGVASRVPVYWSVPRYPARALQLGIEAKIEVSFDIDVKGFVSNIKVSEHKYQHYFRQEIVNTLSTSRFNPVIINGEAVALKDINETFLFVIEESEK